MLRYTSILFKLGSAVPIYYIISYYKYSGTGVNVANYQNLKWTCHINIVITGVVQRSGNLQQGRHVIQYPPLAWIAAPTILKVWQQPQQNCLLKCYNINNLNICSLHHGDYNECQLQYVLQFTLASLAAPTRCLILLNMQLRLQLHMQLHFKCARENSQHKLGPFSPQSGSPRSSWYLMMSEKVGGGDIGGNVGWWLVGEEGTWLLRM